MDLKHLKYFFALAEELHFTRAAVRLNMSQPPLSQTIARLEEELGFKLFERTKRKVVLTDAGKVLLEESRCLLARADTAVQQAKRAALGDLGHLKIAFAPWAELTAIFSEVIRTFSHKHSEVTIDFHSLLGQVALTDLSEGRVDLAFVATPPDPPRNMSHKLVFSDVIVLALPENHPLAKKSIVPLTALREEPQIVVARDRIGSYYQLVERLCEQAGFTMLVRHVIDHPQTTMALVASEAGVSLVPSSYNIVQRPGIVYRHIEPTVRINMVVVWRPDNRSTVLREFLNVIDQSIPADESVRPLAAARPARRC